MTLVFRLGAFTALLVAACASTTSPAPTKTIEPRDFYPLQAGNAWSYDVDTGEASTTLAVTRVESFDGRIAEVRTGQTLLRYEVLSQGIRVPSADQWVLRAPFEEGATWPSLGGRTARLVSMGLRVETLAGTFDDCVLVSETGGKLELEVKTVYCANIGPVLVESTMRSKLSARTLTVSARLRGYEVSPTSSKRP